MRAGAMMGYYQPGSLMNAVPPLMPVPAPYPGGPPNYGCTSALNQPVMAVQNGQLQEVCGKARVYPLNFGADSVAAGATVPLSARPQKTFKVQRLIIPSSIAPFFTIRRISIGTNSQTVDASGIGLSAEVFSEVSQNSLVEFDTACVGIDITMEVTNIDASPRRFAATFLGPSVE
jgi:hypothetical protein